MDNNKSVRIKYNQNNPDNYLKIKLKQDFDFLEVLSLKISQEDVYKMYTSNYGVLVGRVLANDGFGIPNAKVSIFIKNENVNNTDEKSIMYPYSSVSSKNSSDIRYNLLPSEKVSKCHQNVGTFPTKRNLLDNDVLIDVFEEYYKYTTVTNESGDYMIFGVPVGQQQIHVDIDLSDIGVLSQAPRDMEYKGYSIKQFDSPNKFKKSTNLDSLSQIISDDTSVFIYPFWGDETQGDIAISKKNINIQFKFEPTCVFMGSIFTDSVKSNLSKVCRTSKDAGKMSEIMSSQGQIEMIRQTIDGKIENYYVSGSRLINSDGVWCYQIPMNLDYVITDEYGDIVPSKDPTKGIPTRANMRFRITLDDNGDAFVQNKTGVYLVPNNPKTSSDEDYQFDSSTKLTSFTNLMWNKVYSVKNYVPRTQKITLSNKLGFTSPATSRRFNGIKSTNYHETNNPSPYNNIWVDINLRFLLLCIITTTFIKIITIINNLIHAINSALGWVGFKPFKFVTIGSEIAGEDCSYLEGWEKFAPCDNSWGSNKEGDFSTTTKRVKGSSEIDNVLGCIETNLSVENEVVNFDFTNDWLNGSLYAPRYLTKSKKNRKTGLLSSIYCGSKNSYNNFQIIQTCAVAINKNGDFPGGADDNQNCYKDKSCYKNSSSKKIKSGILNQDSVNNIFYYKAKEFNANESVYYMPTDIILLGSLNDCDLDGIPQLHQLLPQTSFKSPPDIFEPDFDSTTNDIDESSDPINKAMSGIDWGNDKTHLENGLFVAIGCTSSDTLTKTCVNASRLCEIGVDFDEKHIIETGNLKNTILIDGYISNDEVSDGDARGMFATLNINGLKTKKDNNNQIKYDFTYNYPNSFDGRLKTESYNGANPTGLTSDYNGNVSARVDYYKFRYGLTGNTEDGYDYSGNNSFPRYENSFYFYFGIKPGLTALDSFNTQYFVPCTETGKDNFTVNLTLMKKESICPANDGSIQVSVKDLVYPYNIYLDNVKYMENINTMSPITINNLTSKYYLVKIVDSSKNSVTKSIFVPKVDYLNFEYSTTANSIIVSGITNDNSNSTSYDYLITNKNSAIITGGTFNYNGIFSEISGLTVGAYYLKLNEHSCTGNTETQGFAIYNKPSISIGEVSSISKTKIDIKATLTDTGGDNCTRGIYWNTSSPAENGTKVQFGGKTTAPSPYEVIITGMTIGQTYYVKAYATNSAGTNYSSESPITHNYSLINNQIVIAKILEEMPELDPITGAPITGDSYYYKSAAPVASDVIINNNSNDNHTIKNGDSESEHYIVTIGAPSPLEPISSISPDTDDVYDYIT